MIRSVLALAVLVCSPRAAEAFTPAARLALGNSPRAGAHALSRRPSRPAVLPALRMADQPDQVIDFGKVGFSDAENQVCTRRPRRRIRALTAARLRAWTYCDPTELRAQSARRARNRVSIPLPRTLCCIRFVLHRGLFAIQKQSRMVRMLSDDKVGRGCSRAKSALVQSDIPGQLAD
jgi:hypothetical protein